MPAKRVGGLHSVYQGRYNAIYTVTCVRRAFPRGPPFRNQILRLQPVGWWPFNRTVHQIRNVPQESRFALKTAYRDRFWKKHYFDALEVIRDASEQEGVPMSRIVPAHCSKLL